MASFHLVSLGCPKNLVDSELMFGLLEQAGWVFEENPQQASMLLINTCGFIQSAVEEAIEEILELTLLKEEDPTKLLVVTGCMVQRYREELVQELPEVDLFIGTDGCHQIVNLVEAWRAGNLPHKVALPERFLMDSTMPRRISTPFYRSWLKITEGCNNRCSYCLIPSIRGDLRSRPIADLVKETSYLEQQGVRELSLIAQDLTAYGNDMGSSVHLTALLKSLLAESTMPWLRLMYLYPSGIDEELLSLMAEQPRIVPYLDIPFQHVSDTVLKRMNRPYTGAFLYELIALIRSYLPDVALRSTFMVGFPGETDADIRQLEQFLKEARLDHVGVFAYANEAGCPSEKFSHQCSDTDKQERLDFIVSVQAEVSAENLKRYVGRVESVLVEGVSRETDLLLEGRTRFQAPDIDGCVYITDGEAKPGDIVQVHISETQIYDLVGEITG